MTDKCSHTDLIARVVALEASIIAQDKITEEKDKRYALRADTQDKTVSQALDSAKTALEKAERSTEKRLEGLNELRGMAEQQASTFARDAEVKLRQQAIEKRIDELAEIVRGTSSRNLGIKDAFGYIAGIGGLLIAALVLIFHK